MGRRREAELEAQIFPMVQSPLTAQAVLQVLVFPTLHFLYTHYQMPSPATPPPPNFPLLRCPKDVNRLANTQSHPGPSPPPPAEIQTAPFPTGEEVRSKIPPTGITVGELLACFKGAVATPEQKTRFTALMRQYSKFDKTTRKLMPVDP